MKSSYKYQITKLGEISIINSGSPAPQNSEFFENGIYPFFRVSDVAKFHISNNLVEAADKLNEQGVKGLKQFKKGVILIPKSGVSCLLNHCAILGCDGYVSSHLAVIKADETKILYQFLFYTLTKIDLKKNINNLNYPSIKIASLLDLEIPLPPLEEQQKIVERLENERKYIESQQEIIRLFERKMQERLNSLSQTHSYYLFPVF